jgi:type VI protein secretion system component Hcp
MKIQNRLILSFKIPACVTAGLTTVFLMLFVGATKAQTGPAITNIYPDGTYQFQPSPTISFYASSAAGVTNVSVTLNSTSLTGQAGLPKTLTSGNGLTVTGPSTDEYVSGGPLVSNTLYSATIKATDANGNLTSTNISFDTINPSYTWEARDWDYTSNAISGLFIDNPQTNAYAGLASTDGTDFHSTNPGQGNASYRPQGLETEGPADTPRLAYSPFTTNVDYDVGYNNGGNWGNYTRHYPAGSYNVYVRASDGNGPQSNAGDISVVAGTASFTNTGPYYFSVNSTGWSTYEWYPLVDSSNNLAILTVPNDGAASTLRLTIDGGNCNENFFMLVPINTNAPVVGDAVITNIFPNGSYQFQQTNESAFTVISSNGINNIEVDYAATNLMGQTSAGSLTSGNGLTVTGSSTNKTVTFPLSTDTVYTVSISVLDGNNNATITNISFDTVNPNYYTWEAEDYNYSSGQYYDNPQTNQYYGLNGTSNIDDYYNDGVNQGGLYRSGVFADWQPGQVTADGEVRQAYINTTNYLGYPNQDYELGFTEGGEWANYTRNFPSGTWNVYMRAASGGNGSSDSASLWSVTSDPTQPNQTTVKLGTFSVPGTGSWTKGAWVPLLNTGGYMARFSGGSLQTLRMMIDNGNCNVNYFMLVPADLSANPPPYLNSFYPDGSSLFQNTNQLNFTVNSSVGISTNNITVNLDGQNVSGLTFSGNQFAWNVSGPVRTNSYHTAIITMSDTAGTTISTNVFGTFDAADYQLEAENYDYTSNGVSGLFFDNQVNAYAGLGAKSNVDCLETDTGAFTRGYTYRTNNGIDFPDTTSGDMPRTQFTSVGKTDYSIGSLGVNSWLNYTRHYPAGTYNVYGRFAEGAGTAGAMLSMVTAGYGTTNQTTSQLGTFSVPNNGWGTWEWVPMVSGATLAKVTLNGSQTTLQLAGTTGNEVNANFLMLVPADLSVPTIGNEYPNGSTFFQGTNALSFTASSSAGISTNNITVTLNGVNVTNLTFSGSSASWMVSAPLQSNALYTAIITVTSLTGNSTSVTNTFDTFSSANYQWEAENYDYTSNGVSGLFFDNQVNAYAGLGALSNVDVLEDDSAAFTRGYTYRSNNGADFPDTTSGDMPRTQFTSVGATDYSIGSFGGGSWANYTHHYPLGTYTVWVRAAEGAGNAACTLSKVTAGVGTTNQTSSLLGTFHILVNGWSTWEWSPLVDAGSNYVKVTFDGSQTTLKLAGEDNEANMNFFMLVPTTPYPPIKASISGGNIVLSFVTQTGYHYQVQYKNNLSDATWTSLGSPLTGNNTVQSVNDAISAGSHRFYRLQIQ